MNNFDSDLEQRLAGIQAQGLGRHLRRVDSAQGRTIEVGGRQLLNFSSNDYLGLANHPALREAAQAATGKFGAGSGASRLICGSLALFHELEESLAAFKGTAAALTFSTGYATALGTIAALLGKEDILVVDKLIHASMVDAARLSGAKLRIFAHNDLNDLEHILKWADGVRNPPTAAKQRPSILIVTESVFSMDGDLAPLREMVELKERYGAWLMVDEAHATGLFGARRRGVGEVTGVSARIEIQMGTLGKAFGSSGGYVCGSRPLIDYLVNRARSFIFSTAPVPAAAGAALQAIELIRSAAGKLLCEQAWARATELQQQLPFPAAPAATPTSLILPFHVGDETAAVALANRLMQAGCFVPAIRYPTVARRTARLRFTATAAHRFEDVTSLASALNS